jgi:uncharacterized UBP type Zn finger protein
MVRECPHLASVVPVAPRSTGCEECLALGETWVHLRACLTCGQVGCCDTSKYKHATKHFQDSGHPLVRSQESGETWIYCYVDKRAVRE